MLVSFYITVIPAATYGCRLGWFFGNSVINMSILSMPHTCMGCMLFIFSDMVRQTTFCDESIMACFSCTTSQSLSVMPSDKLMALIPKKHKSGFKVLILASASAPNVIFEFFDSLSPITITSILGWCIYSTTAGMLPEIKVADKVMGKWRASSIIVVPPHKPFEKGR